LVDGRRDGQNRIEAPENGRENEHLSDLFSAKKYSVSKDIPVQNSQSVRTFQ
jgi:hypothetical protein